MSRDIHMHMEIKIRDKWEHYRYSKEPKDLRFFDNMMDRVDGIKFQVPDDLTQITMLNLKYWVGDAHHIGILGLEAIKQVESWWNLILAKQNSDNTDNASFGYLFGMRWCSLIEYPTELPFEIEDARIIYWFDN